MKHILFLLLLSTAYGQGDFPKGFWDVMKNEKNISSDTVIYYNYKVWGSVLIDSLPLVKPSKEYFVVALPKYWDEYVESLKTDYENELKDELFIASLYGKYCVKDEMNKTEIEYKINGQYHLTNVYRGKPTFEGFIEYLRRHK